MRATAVVAMHPRRTVAPPRASGGIARSVSRRSGVPRTVGDARSRAVAASRRRRVAFVAAVPAPAPAPGAARSSIARTRAARRVVARARDDAGGDAEPPEAVPGDAGDGDVDVDDDAGDASAPDASGEADEDEEDEYEEVEVEVEVDYTPLDHARDALDSLGTWSDVSAWPRAKDDVADVKVSSTPSALASTAFAAEATRAFSAAPGGALPMAPVSGLAVAFAFAVGAVFGRKSAESKSAAAADVLADLAARAGGAAGGGAAGFQPMTEEQRVADEARKAKKAEEARLAELARRKKRDEDEAKFVASEKARLEKEAAAARKAAEEEEKRRAKARAELAERAEIERVYLEEKRAKEEAERARREAEALAEQERKRERERLEMEARLTKQNAERERRGETTRRFEVSAFVSFAYRAARGDVEVEVRARAGISSPATESGVYASVAQARVAATAMCTSVAKTAVASWASDQRLKLMTGDAGRNSPLRAANASEHAGGFDECEFEHWTRVGGARLDAELRALTQRAGAGVEFKMRAPGGGDANQSASSEAELVLERAALPLTDRDNVANRLYAAMLAAGDGAFGVASDDLEWVARFELGQLHGLDGGLCFPAVTQADLSDPDKRLKGGLLALMVTLSHWLARARLELLGSAGADPEASDADPGARKTYANCAALANRMLTTEANAEGASWKAMYLDGFSGDVLSQAASTARAVLPKRDPIRAMLEAAEEEQRRKLAGVPTTDEEAYPDREASRKARHKAERDAVPLAEKLWAMRNAAAQMAVSGSKGQARSMLEEAYQLRVEALAKRKAREEEENKAKNDTKTNDGQKEKVVVAPELLPELTALEDLFASEKAWSRELAGVRAQVLKAVRTAADRAASAGDARRAAALLEGAAREYGGERKLGPEHPAARAAFAAAEEAWAAAGIEPGDEDAKDAALAEAAGTPVPRGQGGGIVLRLTKKYLEELEARRK